MKKLFVYYSYTGNGDLVAGRMAGQGYYLRAVKRKKKMPKSFFWGIMTGGFLASVGKKDKLVDFDENIGDYDEIVIGSPIWNARFASPINTVLSKLNFEGKKVSFLLYSGSGEAPKAVERIKKEYPTAKIVLLKEPKKYPDELEKLKDL